MRAIVFSSEGCVAAAPLLKAMHARGWVFVEAASERELLALARETAPSLIAIQSTTPREETLAILARSLRSSAARVPLLLVTESCPGELAIAAMRAGFNDVLLESELFGYERGAFTGAHAAREGKLQYAQGGTLFLDEVGDMNLYAQAKILRAIESRKVQRLGGHREIAINIRIIAATNHNLEQLTSQQKFRQDLYF